MLSVTERLLRLMPRKYADSFSANGGPHVRVSSPLPGGSTLITSAPMSPSIIVHRGPASMRVKSSTRSPSSAPTRSDALVMEKHYHEGREGHEGERKSMDGFCGLRSRA